MAREVIKWQHIVIATENEGEAALQVSYINTLIDKAAKKVLGITFYTKSATHQITSNTAAKVYDAIRIGGDEIIPRNLETSLFYPTIGASQEHRNINVPVGPGTYISGSISHSSELGVVCLLKLLCDE